MAKTDIWMPLYVADYLADTMRLTTLQHGAYLLLILDYWRNGPLPDDPQTLAQITRMPVDAWDSASSKVLVFFERRDGLLIHDRIDHERTVAINNKSKKAAAGSNGAKAKWGDTTSAENRATRSERLAAARRLATHSPAEWLSLREIVGCCAKCGSSGELVKDHIKPIYQGGSDGIENIQPLCRSCNAAKGPEDADYRPQNWRELLAERLANAYQTPNPSPSPLPKPKATSKTKAVTPSALPDWLPLDAWSGYLEMRKKQKKVPTERAIELVIKALDAMRATGQDIAAVLDKSTAMGWTDVYAIRDDRRPQNNGRPSINNIGVAAGADADIFSQMRRELPP